MPHYNIAEAKARFSEIVRKALAGEEVVIARDGRPLVILLPIPAARGKRRPGTARGKVWIAPDFDETPADFEEYTR
jgi:prevent-host-death family protein